MLLGHAASCDPALSWQKARAALWPVSRRPVSDVVGQEET